MDAGTAVALAGVFLYSTAKRMKPKLKAEWNDNSIFSCDNAVYTKFCAFYQQNTKSTDNLEKKKRVAFFCQSCTNISTFILKEWKMHDVLMLLSNWFRTKFSVVSDKQKEESYSQKKLYQIMSTFIPKEWKNQ